LLTKTAVGPSLRRSTIRLQKLRLSSNLKWSKNTRTRRPSKKLIEDMVITEIATTVKEVTDTTTEKETTEEVATGKGTRSTKRKTVTEKCNRKEATVTVTTKTRVVTETEMVATTVAMTERSDQLKKLQMKKCKIRSRSTSRALSSTKRMRLKWKRSKRAKNHVNNQPLSLTFSRT